MARNHNQYNARFGWGRPPENNYCNYYFQTAFHHPVGGVGVQNVRINNAPRDSPWSSAPWAIATPSIEQHLLSVQLVEGMHIIPTPRGPFEITLQFHHPTHKFLIRPGQGYDYDADDPSRFSYRDWQNNDCQWIPLENLPCNVEEILSAYDASFERGGGGRDNNGNRF
mmetsp:Transcript_31380/g.63768  ORF Transcript_31380/g.63768 Transcript_31380/m.63768 type:complete len:168 (+) Transcript_31380:3-506(+)